FACLYRHPPVAPGALSTFPTRRSSDLSYFPGPSVGIQAEMAYFGLPLRDACVVLNASPTRLTEQLCASAQGASHSTSALATNEIDRKSTRLNSSHVSISYAVFCLTKKR